VHASIGMLRGSSSERLRGGIDELFSAARFAVAPTDLSGGARAGASSPLPLGLRLAYDAIYTPGATPSTFANLVHVGVLTLETPCRCAGLRLTASLPTHDLRALGGLQFSLLIDLKSLGSVAAF